MQQMRMVQRGLVDFAVVIDVMGGDPLGRGSASSHDVAVCGRRLFEGGDGIAAGVEIDSG